MGVFWAAPQKNNKNKFFLISSGTVYFFFKYLVVWNSQNAGIEDLFNNIAKKLISHYEKHNPGSSGNLPSPRQNVVVNPTNFEDDINNTNNRKCC